LSVASQEIEALGCPKDVKDLEKLNEDFLKANTSSIEHVHEYIKLRQKFFGDKDVNKFEGLTVTALNSDPKKNDKIYQSIDLHKRLVKAGANGTNFKSKAKDQFKYATYFQE
jgi:hypothetical protein